MNKNRWFEGLLLSLLCVATGYAQDYHAPPDVVATLPKFCWAQYTAAGKGNPEYSVQGCGAFWNHYCPGLVHMARAQREKDLGKKEQALGSARVDMEYTLRYTQDYPECALRPLAQQNLIRIKSELELVKIMRQNKRRSRY
jgi:hypothetical protein